jgi:hypothetical protein
LRAVTNNSRQELLADIPFINAKNAKYKGEMFLFTGKNKPGKSSKIKNRLSKNKVNNIVFFLN